MREEGIDKKGKMGALLRAVLCFLLCVAGALVVGAVPTPGPDDIEVISEKPDNIILQ